MQKNMKVIETVLISNPEAFFEQDNLSYQSGEVQEIINNFTAAAEFSDIHARVIDLLQATANFRYATVPNGIFFTMRNTKKSEKELMDIFNKMEKAYANAEKHLLKFEKMEKQILMNALSYAAKSILERIKSLQPSDKLLPLWEVSSLKKIVKNN